MDANAPMFTKCASFVNVGRGLISLMIGKVKVTLMDEVMLHFPTAFHIESSNTPDNPKWLLMWLMRILQICDTEEEAKTSLGNWLTQDIRKRS
jgi:hypothetical protein